MSYMSYLDKREELLNHAVGVRSGVPYAATISQGEEVLAGHVVFSGKGRLTFDFYHDDFPYHNSPFGRDFMLQISSLDVNLKARCFGDSPMPVGPGMAMMTRLSGELVLVDNCLGIEVEGLTSLTLFYGGLPIGWQTSVPWFFRRGYTDKLDNTENLGTHVLDSIDLKSPNWRVSLRSYDEVDVVDSVRHFAVVERDEYFSGDEALEFARDNLHPFLSFLFGCYPKVVLAQGGKDYRALWGFLGYENYSTSDRRLRNWFSKVGRSYDPSDIFAAFCGLGEEDKETMSSMITHYATSEEIFASAIHPAVVASYSALEGLVRWIAYSDEDIRPSWFAKPKGRRARKERRLKEDVSLLDLIALILVRESLIPKVRASEVRAIVKSLRDVRDSIAHVTEMHALEGDELYHTWNKSQFLVEALILRKLGFTGDVPNRTKMWKIVVEDEDLTKQEREEGELWLDSSDEGETGETE